MTTVTLNKRYLFSLVSNTPEEGKIEAQLAKLGCNVERISGDEISIEVSPNRPDLFSAVGLARALRNFMHRSKKYVYQTESDEPYLRISVGSKAEKVRPFLACLIAANMKLNEAALADLINFTEKFCETYGRSRKKIAIGIHDFNKVEPPLVYDAYSDGNFVALNETKERSFSEILKTTEQGKKYGRTLAGKLYPALKDNNGVIALIPILNSERTRLEARTKNILVDITGTDGSAVNKTSDLLAAMFMDLGANVKKAVIAYPKTRVVTPPLEKRYLTLPLFIAEGEIGVSIGFSNVITLANKMGYDAALLGRDIRFRVPEYRMDVINEQDIVEDLAIAYGYDYINPMPVPSEHPGKLDPREELFDSLSEAMVGMGYSETVNTYLTNEKTNFTDMRTGTAYKDSSTQKTDYIRLKAARAQSVTMLRTWLLPSLLKNIGASAHEKMPQKAFELDLVFSMVGKTPREDYHLAGVLTGPRSNFNDIKGTLDSLAYLLGLVYNPVAYAHESFIRGRCARVSIGKENMGMFGELHPEVLNNFGIEEPTSVFEIDLTWLINSRLELSEPLSDG